MLLSYNQQETACLYFLCPGHMAPGHWILSLDPGLWWLWVFQKGIWIYVFLLLEALSSPILKRLAVLSRLLWSCFGILQGWRRRWREFSSQVWKGGRECGAEGLLLSGWSGLLKSNLRGSEKTHWNPFRFRKCQLEHPWLLRRPSCLTTASCEGAAHSV